MLKIFALILMLIDHIGMALFPTNILLRLIGRLSFPIFAFSLTEGYSYTKDRKKYFKRLLLFALISQIPYTLLREGFSDIQTPLLLLVYKPSTFAHVELNIGFTLLLGMIALFLIDRFNANKKDILSLILLGGIIFISILLKVDYEAYGIIAIILFYIFKNNKLALFGTFAFLPILLIDLNQFSIAPLMQFTAILSLPIIFWIKDKEVNKTIKLPKWVFYSFYPVHMLVLWIIRII